MALNAYFTADEVSSYRNDSSNENILNVIKSDLNGLYGVPYQFMDTVDPRIEGTNLGAKYAEKIISNIPLLFLIPCKQIFMPGFSDSTKNMILESLTNGTTPVGLDDQTGRYYAVQYDTATYFDYVNTMLTMLCRYMGVGDTEIKLGTRTGPLKAVDWQNVRNSSFNEYLNAKQAVVFYVDGVTSMSDSFSNSTTESSLASTINGYSEQANEIRFLLGDTALTQLATSMGDVTESITSGLSGNLSNFTGGMLSDLASKGVSTIVSGGKIVFPKIWSDSSFDRSYSFDIKLRSPDHDNLSIFLNIFVPFIHILAMTLPKANENNDNAFQSPFLVKAYYKGLFNIDMGIITGLSVTRGAECQWNEDGLPTQMDISIDITDLYSNMFMTKESFPSLPFSIVNNTAMMDYLCNLAGLNIAEQEWFRKATMFNYLTTSDIARIPSRIYSKLQQGINVQMKKLYSLF